MTTKPHDFNWKLFAGFFLTQIFMACCAAITIYNIITIVVAADWYVIQYDWPKKQPLRAKRRKRGRRKNRAEQKYKTELAGSKIKNKYSV